MAKPTDPNYDTLQERAMDLDPPQFISKKPSLVERFRNGNGNRREPIVDMHGMERTIVGGPPPEYIPAKDRQPYTQENLPDLAVKVIETFGAIPTKELDDMIHAIDAEITSIKTDAQSIRDEYTRRTEQLVARIKRLTSGCAMARDTLDLLRDQVVAMDQQQPPPTPTEATS